MTDLLAPLQNGRCRWCRQKFALSPTLHVATAHPDIYRAAAHVKAAESCEEAAREQQATARTFRESAEALLEKARPSFPTDLQKVGIIEAVGRIRLGEESSLHGDPTLSGMVNVHAPRAWLRIFPRGPWSPVGHHGRMWQFTLSERAAIVRFIESLGVTVEKVWLADGSLSVTLVKPVPAWPDRGERS